MTVVRIPRCGPWKPQWQAWTRETGPDGRVYRRWLASGRTVRELFERLGRKA